MTPAGRGSGAGADQLDPAGVAAVQAVLGELRSERASVSTVTEGREAWEIHVADSLSGLEVDAVLAAARIADIGSGTGFPGLALAAALPAAEVDLIESVGRKCEFMRRAIEVAGIKNASVINARAEDWACGEGRERYDVVVARAVGRLSVLAELASPMLGEAGVLVAWKGRRDPEEEAELERAVAAVGMEADQVIPVVPYPGSRNRHIHVLRKTGPTPAGIPRRAGIARKRPHGSQ